MSSKPKRRKRLAFAAALISVGIVIVAAELLLVATGHRGGPGIRTASDPIFDQIPGIFEPNQDVIDRHKPPLRYRVTINSLGFRGRELSVRKAPGTRRILCLGDSFTYGEFVNDDETFPYYLEGTLRGAGFDVDVVNDGVEDTTIVDHFAFLKKGIAISPDIVILTFYENDIDDLIRKEPMHVGLERNRKLKSSPGLRYVYRMARDSATFNFLLGLRARMQFNAKRSALDEVRTDKEQLWRSYEAELEAMRQFLEARSVLLLLAIYPSAKRIAGEIAPGTPDAEITGRVRQLAHKHAIPAIDLRSPLEASKEPIEHLYLVPHDEHASPHGNRIVADALAKFVAPYLRDR
jgi:lysophospholipase L1-like esterase